MRGFLTLVAVAFLLASCTTVDNLRPQEKGTWISLKNTSYATVFDAAETVVSRHLHVVQSDRETGTVKGVDSSYSYLWREAAGIYIWPTITNGSGYMVYVDSSRSMFQVSDPRNWGKDPRDWSKIFLEDLKKELGAI